MLAAARLNADLLGIEIIHEDMTPDQLDTIFKVGLGAAISVISAVLLALVTHLLHKSRAAEEWRRTLLDEVTEEVGDYVEKFNLVISALGSSRSVEAHLAGRAGQAEALEHSLKAFTNSWVSKGKAQVKLYLLGDAKAAIILGEFRSLYNELLGTYIDGEHKLVSEGELKDMSEKINEIEGRFYARLRRHY